MFNPLEEIANGFFSAGAVFTVIAVAMVCGVFVMLTYVFSRNKRSFSKDLAVSLAVLPGIVSAILMLVGSSVARALSLAGIFAMVRFRSAPGSAVEMVLIFISMAVGLACGLGYIAFAGVITATECIFLIVLTKTPLGKSEKFEKQLRVTIPENLNYETVFSDIFEQYLDKWKLMRVKTTNMGTMFELTYMINMKNNVSEKEFIDDIRVKNANLNVTIGITDTKEETTL